MIARISGLCLLLTGLSIFTACQSPRTIPDGAFQILEKADRIDVATSRKQVRTIVQPWRIRKAAKLLSHYSAGWRKPLSGTPLSNLVLGFRDGPAWVGRFGIGPDFITMGDDLLWIQPLSPQDRLDLLACLAIEERVSKRD